MNAPKYWAYAAETGSQRVSAWGVARERDERYRGDPTGRTYWSAHEEGRRKPMAHAKYPNRAPFFRYIHAADEADAGPGESLEHRLFKEAVASISGTQLSLGAAGDHRIRVTHAQIERQIAHPAGRYFADVWLRFESDTDLGLKWAGEVCIEIRHTHGVPAEKLDAVTGLRVPMIEVPIPERLLYRFPGEQTTDEREQAYKAQIRTMLESDRGFLRAVVLSDPSSAPFLEQELAAARTHIELLGRKVTQAERAVLALLEQGAQWEAKHNQAQLTIRNLSQQFAARSAQHRDAVERLQAWALASQDQGQALRQMREQWGDSRRQVQALDRALRRSRFAAWAAGGLGVLLLGLLGLLAWPG